MPKAYSYIRMSTDIQLKGDSLRRQLDISMAYASKNGLILVEDEALKDIGLSAYRGANLSEGAALGRFLKAVKDGRIDRGSFLLIESLDRLTRQHPQAALPVFFEILNAGITIVTTFDEKVYAGQVDFSNLMYSMLVMQRAFEESETKSRRGTEAWKAKRAQHAAKILTARCPAWLKSNEDRTGFAVLEDKAAVVRLIFAEASQGKGARLICRILNEKKVAPLGAARSWGASSVQKILCNRAVVGELVPHTRELGRREPTGEIFKDYYPKIVTEEDFAVAARSRQVRGVRGGGRRGLAQANLFPRLLKCAYCFSSIVYINKGFGTKGGQYLQCRNGASGRGCCPTTWRYSSFETSVLTFVRDLDLQAVAAGAARISALEDLKRRLAAAELQAEQCLQSMDTLHRQIKKRPELEDYLLSKIAPIEAERSRAIALQEDLQNQISTSGSSGALASDAEVRALVKQFSNAEGDRFALAARISDIIAVIEVAPAGSHWGADSLSPTRLFASPYFMVQFRSGAGQLVQPNPADPAELLRGLRHRPWPEEQDPVEIQNTSEGTALTLLDPTLSERKKHRNRSSPTKKRRNRRN